MKYYLAIDLGASSGRHIIGYKDGNEIKCVEVYRFKNGMVEKDGHLIWDIESIFNNVKKGIKEALKKYPKIESLAIDTWGVDYCLLNGDKEILPVYAYRDSRTDEPIKKVHEIIPFEKLFERTGIAFNSFNTIYQLYDDLKTGRLDNATDFLMIPEYLSYKLTGIKKKEYTDASTTGLINVITKEFDTEIIEKLGLKKEIFKPLSEGGSVVGNFTDEIKAEVGGDITVKLCYSHDTASAVHAIDYTDPYISSGTWSLLGVKQDVAHTDLKSLKDGFSNEGGKNRTFRYQKNISGMWIINNICKENGTSPKDLVEIIDDSNYDYTFDVNKECFTAPKSMTEAITNELKNQGYPLPKTLADIARSSLKSLAKAYASSVHELEETLNQKYESIVIVGGGANNRKLNQFTEEFSNKKVIALPIEATSIGNLKAQMEE